jgi:type IV pilus assembly protein PilF
MTMTITARGLHAARCALGWAAIAGALMLGLGGCASPHPAGTTATGDIPTASDETDARKRARIRLELAVGYFEQGKTEVALDEVKQVIATDPSFSDAYVVRGAIYMRLNDSRLAEDSFRRAIALNPRDSDAHHNLGWMQCQQGRYADAQREFEAAIANPLYAGRAKSLMAEGVCQAKAGQLAEAEKTLGRSYELDPGNPITGYNLASLLYRRGENTRAQFVIRQLNNSELANAESLWLGIKVERRLNDRTAMLQLGEQLRKRFASSREAAAYDRGAFDE